jgi:hypothetical protein
VLTGIVVLSCIGKKEEEENQALLGSLEICKGPDAAEIEIPHKYR